MGRGTRTRLDVAPLIVPPAGPVGGGVGLFGVKPMKGRNGLTTPFVLSGLGCAPVRIVSQRGESPRQKEVWPDEAEGNCVAAMRGGEQPKAKDSSVTHVNSIRFVTLASLQSNGEAQMTPTTSKEE